MDELSHIVYPLAGEIQNGEYSLVRSATDREKFLPLRPWMKGKFWYEMENFTDIAV